MNILLQNKIEKEDIVKKYAIFVLISCSLYTAHSQDLSTMLENLIHTKDSLQNELNIAREISAKELKVAKNSIDSLSDVFRTTFLDLNGKITKLESDTAELHNKIKKLDKKNIASLETQIQQKTDLINRLKDTINDGVKKEKEKYNKGQEDVYSKIGQPYQTINLDSLIKYSTKQSIERDLQLIGNNAEVKNTLQELKVYFNSEQVLKEQYNEEEVKIALSELSHITQSDLVKSLKEKIDNYKSCNDALKNRLDSIIKLDKVTANTENTKKKKLQEILPHFSWYLYNYLFNFTDYPYLSYIVSETMKLKQKDPNADIKNIFSKL